jgi:hypothetical protein
MITCTLYAHSTSPHVSQLYTGFSLLAMKGEIRLKQKLYNYSHENRPVLENLEPDALNGLFVTVNDKVLFYDTSDSSDPVDGALQIVDAYFKRSYVQERLPERYASRVFPLGLNYELYTGRLEYHEVARFIWRKSVLRYPRVLLRAVAELASLSFLPTTINMYSPPKHTQEPRVLFMARAWDPKGELADLSEEEKRERININEMRARCIELLRGELGHHFYGGFARTAYAVENFKGLLLEDALVSGKQRYVSVLHEYPICIATAGLHGSIGWKMGEYVAFSKAIVSERLNCSVPCDFRRDRNYLEFDTPELCLEQTMKLVEDRGLRWQMMEDNWNYYNLHLMPDKLIMRTLKIASEIPRSSKV